MIRLSMPSLLVAVLLLPALPAAATAPEQGQAVQVSPAPVAAPALANSDPADPAFADLIGAMEGSVDQNRMIENGLAAIARQMAADPGLAAAEKESPGLIAEIAENMRPIIVAQNQRVTGLYRPEMLAVIARHLTPAEATSIAAFYRSDVGRKLMANVSANYSFDARIENALAEKPVTAEDVKTDVNSAVVSSVAQLDPKDLAEMGRMALANPALFKLQRVNPEIQQVRVKMENEPLTPEENAAILETIMDIFARRLGK